MYAHKFEFQIVVNVNACLSFCRNGSEWLNNRRLMNKLLLNGNSNWMNDTIEKYTRKCITKWSEEIDKSTHGFIEINDLEKQLYRWSINGRVTCMNVIVLISDT